MKKPVSKQLEAVIPNGTIPVVLDIVEKGLKKKRVEAPGGIAIVKWDDIVKVLE